MHLVLASLAAVTTAIAPAAAAPDPAPASPAMQSLWVDWSELNAQSTSAEKATDSQAVRPAPAARALGDQVGEMVALGDCHGGERVAREAGDIMLARAVRDHCWNGGEVPEPAPDPALAAPPAK